MEYLRLKGISKAVHIGIGKEQEKKTTIVVDVELGIDGSRVGETDNLDMGIDYREVHRIVLDEMKDGYITIEAMGYRIFQSLKKRLLPGHLSVVVKKPNPPLDGSVEVAEVEFRL